MENKYELKELSLREIKAILQGLNNIQISGADAMFIGMLQVKIQSQIKTIEEEKQKELEKVVEEDNK